MFSIIVQELCRSLAPFQTFIVRHQKASNISRCKEKSWTNFYHAAVSGFPSIAAVTGCKKFGVLLAIETFSHLLEITFPQQRSTSKTPAFHLSARDCDVVSHIGGSIVSKLQRRYKRHKQDNREECISCLCNNSANPGTLTSLTEVLDRGGLKNFTQTASSIFVQLECTFRECFDSIKGNMSLSNYQSRVPDTVTCNFYESTCDSSFSEDVRDVVLSDVIKLIFKIRCHSQLQKIVRTFRVTLRGNRSP